MVKFFLFFCVIFSFLCLPVHAALSSKGDQTKIKETTEAGFVCDSTKSSDFFCGRSYKSESVHDLSALESQRIVNKTLSLYSKIPDSSLPSTAPSSSGQR